MGVEAEANGGVNAEAALDNAFDAWIDQEALFNFRRHAHIGHAPFEQAHILAQQELDRVLGIIDQGDREAKFVQLAHDVLERAGARASRAAGATVVGLVTGVVVKIRGRGVVDSHLPGLLRCITGIERGQFVAAEVNVEIAFLAHCLEVADQIDDPLDHIEKFDRAVNGCLQLGATRWVKCGVEIGKP